MFDQMSFYDFGSVSKYEMRLHYMYTMHTVLCIKFHLHSVGILNTDDTHH
jgi:hypothetical protein